MIEATIDLKNSALETIQSLLRSLLESGTLDALLVPMTLPAGNVSPMLVTDPNALDRANPLAPVLPINAARAASLLTATEHHQSLGLVLRACEIRALVELVKFQQINLDNADAGGADGGNANGGTTAIIGIDCLGTYSVSDYQQAPDKEALLDDLLAQAPDGQLQPAAGLQFRDACRICEQPLPQGEHVALTIGLLGVQRDKLYLKARDDLAEALGLEANGAPPVRESVVDGLIAARTEARDAVFADFRQRVHSMEGLLQEFSTCIRCHNCMINCPICYCRECIFRTPTFEHESQLFFQWAERKGTVRLLPDTLLFHITRLNHMVTSCVGCGICTDVCPVDIPVSTVFRTVGQKVQAIFDYHPGRSLEEAAPVQEFREEELTDLGERPR